jgi:FkbM family methyltransferase
VSDPSDAPPQTDGPISVKEVVARCPNAGRVTIVGACDARLPMQYRAALPKAEILAIEAVPENYDRWLKPREEFDSICAVVGAKREARRLFIQNQNGIHGLYDRGFCVEKRHCSTIRLYDLLTIAKHGIPDILSIDVEGAAYEVLEGAARILPAVQVVMVETESAELFKGQKHFSVDVGSFLTHYGFHCELVRSAEILEGKFQHEELWCR